MRAVRFRLDALGALILVHRTDDGLHPGCLQDPGPPARDDPRYGPVASGGLGGSSSAMAAVYATSIAVSLFGSRLESAVQGLSGDGTYLQERGPPDAIGTQADVHPKVCRLRHLDDPVTPRWQKRSAAGLNAA
jgi:hypothetical protein